MRAQGKSGILAYDVIEASPTRNIVNGLLSAVSLLYTKVASFTVSQPNYQTFGTFEVPLASSFGLGSLADFWHFSTCPDF